MEGMERIVASVSGYHGSERFKLIKLISLSGASYVGAFSRSITHLVCWKFEGEKYKLAKKFGTKIVNHRWIEDCIKEGKRISEQPYTQLSGKQVGSLLLEVPAVSDVGVLRENKLVLNSVYKSCTVPYQKINKSCTDPVVDVEYENTEHHEWDDRWFFNKCEESSKRASKPSRKQKRIHDSSRDTISTDPPRTSRRLVKGNVNKYPVECVNNNGKECLTNEILNVDQNVASTSNNYSLRNGNEARISERSDDVSTSQRRARNQGSFEREVVEVLDTGAEGLIFQREERLTEPERALEDTIFDGAEYVKDELKIADPVEQSARSPTSLDLSCVICWTDFCSTRGVLPCGHRFCFPCIQNWADSLVSKGKTSTCPLCKATFMTITKVGDADCRDQKIYSQTIPCASSTQDIFILPDDLPVFSNMQVSSVEPVCCECHLREPEDLLVQCDSCHIRCIHCYCLDPPLFPWKCSGCKDRRMFY